MRLELEPFYQTGLLSIQESEVLNPSELEEFRELMPEIRHVFDTQTIWRTRTEAVCSVLNDLKHPTASSKYHQAKLEQSVMADNLIVLSFDYREKLVDLKETNEKMKAAQGFELERLQIQRERLIYNLDSMRRQAKDRLREVKMWSEIKASLNNGTFDIGDKDSDELLGLTLRYCQELPTALRSKDSAGSINIIGQTITLLKECRKRGIQKQLGDLGKQAEKMLE